MAAPNRQQVEERLRALELWRARQEGVYEGERHSLETPERKLFGWLTGHWRIVWKMGVVIGFVILYLQMLSTSGSAAKLDKLQKMVEWMLQQVP